MKDAMRRPTLRQHFQRFVQVRVFGMDIDPSARIAATALIDRTWPKGVHIGAGCVIGEEAVLLTHDMTRGIYLDTRIGNGTVVGPRALILPGVTVGANCRIMPGAMVNRDMPDGSQAIGNPARIEPIAAVPANASAAMDAA